MSNHVVTPISPNPFIVGKPVRNRAMFFGREAEFESVRRSFTGIEAKSLFVLCGERQSGKTSILLQILDGRLGPGFLPVLIDMSSMTIESEMDFLGKIAEGIGMRLDQTGESVPSTEMIDGSNPAASFHKFVGKVLKANPERKITLLFDEYEVFEDKIDAGILTEDTLFTLSSLMENHTISLVFTGSVGLEERKRDYWKIFLARSISRRIGHLDPADAERLITEPVKDRVHYQDGVVDAIYRVAEGQPFQIQAICRNLVELLNQKQSSQASLEMVDEAVALMARIPARRLPLWAGAIGVAVVLVIIGILAVKLRGS